MPLRVAVLARSVYPLHQYGGLERHVFDLVRHLLASDVNVALIAPPRSSQRPVDRDADTLFENPRLSYRSVPYTTFPFANRRGTTILDRSTAYPVFGLRAGRLAARLVTAGEIDSVHGLGASALGYASADCEGARAPLVFNPQGLEEFGATDPSRAPLKRLAYWPLRMAVRRTAAASDCVIATDRSLVGAVVSHLAVRPEAVRVIPNAISLQDCDRPAAAPRARLLREGIGLAPDDVLLVSVGRLEANKGFGVLVRALSALRAANRLPQRWRWVLVGDGPMRDTLARDVASSGLGDCVVLSGRAGFEDLHGWYEAATVFIHPTLYEGSSLVTLEAMAHRRAVIASRAGGLPDKVLPEVNGWLVPPGDPHPLAAAITDALSDRRRLSSMGAASRTIVEKEFSWDAAVTRLIGVYEEMLARRKPL